MNLRLKLPLSFALALGLMLLGALFGIYQLNHSLDVYEHQVLATVAAHKKVAQVDAKFSTAIQEWKNVLLRGKDPKDLDKYWASHLKEMQAVQEGLRELDQMPLGADARDTLGKLGRAIPVVADAYKKALEEYKAAGFDSAAGELAGDMDSVPALIAFAVLVGVGAPIVEELAFRGLLFGSLVKRGMPIWFTILVSGGIFALFHFEPIRIPLLMSTGLVLAFARYQQRSLTVPIVAHMVNNIPAAIALVLMS